MFVLNFPRHNYVAPLLLDNTDLKKCLPQIKESVCYVTGEVRAHNVYVTNECTRSHSAQFPFTVSARHCSREGAIAKPR